MRQMLVLLLVFGLMASGVIVPEKSFALDRRTSSEQTATDGEKAVAEATESTLLYNVPTSLDGPIDPDTYVLGPSDELFLVLRGPETVFHQLRVLPEGDVILPNIGPYDAAGLTLSQFRTDVVKALKRYYRNIDMDILLTKPRNFVVYVSGEITRPGAVELAAPSRVSHAIAAAGGIVGNASTRQIEVREDGDVVGRVDLFMFLQYGDFEHNPVLKEGQNVYVPVQRTRVEAIGEVRKPGAYEILPGETVEDLIRFSGGFATTADQRHLLLERTTPGEEVTTVVFDSDSSKSIELRDMDVVVIPDLASLLGMEPVAVIGGGGRGGTFQIKESERLKEFLLRLWRFTYQYDIESAVIERWVDDDEPLYIYFNVREVLAGDPVGETALKPGDTVSFPTRETQIFVTGEVVLPGAFPFQPGFSAERYIALAGGPNERGSYNKVDIFGSEGNSRKGDRHSLIYRGETIVVKTKTSRMLAGLFWGATSLTGLILAIYAVSQ